MILDSETQRKILVDLIYAARFQGSVKETLVFATEVQSLVDTILEADIVAPTEEQEDLE